MACEASAIGRPEMIRDIGNMRLHDHKIRTGFMSGLKKAFIEVDRRIMGKHGMAGSLNSVFRALLGGKRVQLFPEFVRGVRQRSRSSRRHGREDHRKIVLFGQVCARGNGFFQFIRMT